MRFFGRCRIPAWIALLALAVQLGLSFGHVHAAGEDEYRAHGLALGACRASAEHPCPRSPAHHHDSCAICWAMMIAGSLVHPAPPALPVLYASSDTNQPDGGLLPAPAKVAVNFQARGPPPLRSA
jgi:hypothetical protein